MELRSRINATASAVVNGFVAAILPLGHFPLKLVEPVLDGQWTKGHGFFNRLQGVAIETALPTPFCEPVISIADTAGELLFAQQLSCCRIIFYQFFNYSNIFGQPQFFVLSGIASMLAIFEHRLVYVANREFHKKPEREIKIHANSKRLIVSADFVVSRLRNQRSLQSKDAFLKEISDGDSIAGQTPGFSDWNDRVTPVLRPIQLGTVGKHHSTLGMRRNIP